MEWMKACAAIAATRFARKPTIVWSVDDIHFFCPIKVGDRVVIRAQVSRQEREYLGYSARLVITIFQVNRCFTNSMEVGVRLDKMTLGGDVVHGLSGKIAMLCY